VHFLRVRYKCNTRHCVKTTLHKEKLLASEEGLFNSQSYLMWKELTIEKSKRLNLSKYP
jgi:hypothetical protein